MHKGKVRHKEVPQLAKSIVSQKGMHKNPNKSGAMDTPPFVPQKQYKES